MQRKPDRGLVRIGDLDPVAGVGRDQDVVAGAERSGLRLVFEAQHRAAGEQDDPFGLGLVVPLPLRARLAGGDDAHQAHARHLGQGIGELT